MNNLSNRSNDYLEELEELASTGQINLFMFNYLRKVIDAVDDTMWIEAINNAITASEAGVDDEAGHRCFFYIDNFVEELMTDVFGMALNEREQEELKTHMFKIKDRIAYTSLEDFRVAVLDWMKTRKELLKEAYPNKIRIDFKLPAANLNDWATLAVYVRKELKAGIDEKTATLKAAESLPINDRLDFITWYRFKYGIYSGLYNQTPQHTVSNVGENNMGVLKSKLAFVHETDKAYYLPQYNKPTVEVEPLRPFSAPESELDKTFKGKFEVGRNKLVGRTFAIDKILEQYKDVFTNAQISEIEDALNDLRKRVRRLSLASTVRDTVIKTAGFFDRKGFSNIGSYLKEVLAEFVGEPTKLTKFAAADQGTIEDLLKQLAEVSRVLQRRDLVRQIATVDLELHKLNMSSYFPELGEAQSKLIDAMGYASNKLEDVIPKIRGGIAGATAEHGMPGEKDRSGPKPIETAKPVVAPLSNKPTATLPKPPTQSLI